MQEQARYGSAWFGKLRVDCMAAWNDGDAVFPALMTSRMNLSVGVFGGRTKETTKKMGGNQTISGSHPLST